MSRAVKIAISLPEELLDTAERERRARGESRSEFIRRALEQYLREQQERAAIERYVRGYLEHPETDEEVEVSDRLAAEAAASEPWE